MASISKNMAEIDTEDTIRIELGSPYRLPQDDSLVWKLHHISGLRIMFVWN